MVYHFGENQNQSKNQDKARLTEDERRRSDARTPPLGGNTKTKKNKTREKKRESGQKTDSDDERINKSKSLFFCAFFRRSFSFSSLSDALTLSSKNRLLSGREEEEVKTLVEVSFSRRGS